MDNIRDTNFDDDQDIMKLVFDNPDITRINPIAKVNSFVERDKRIGEYFTRNGNKFPILSPFYGKVLKFDTEDKVIVLERCKHEAFYINLCVACNYDRRTDKNERSKTSTEIKLNKYASLHPVLTFSEKKAKEEEMNKVNRLLSSRKLILLLDLDNTILHSCPFDLSKEDYNHLKERYGNDIAALGLTHPVYPHKKQRFVLKFRPFFKNLIDNIKDKFEIYTYTHGTKDYATEIISYVNSIFEENVLSLERLIARENHNIEIKTVKKVFPTTEDMVIILDDRTDVWADNSPNLVNVRPYTFFADEKLLKIPERFLPMDDDHVLYSVCKLMNFVHASFYYTYEENKTKLDVKNIIDRKIKQVLNGINITTSGVFYKNEDIYQTWHSYIIEKLGAHLWDEYDEDTDIVLANEYKMTEKISKATKDNKRILHTLWLNYCDIFLHRVKEDDFLLSKTNQILDQTKLNQGSLLKLNQDGIDEFYSTEPEKLKEFLNTIK